jgi:sulfur carrier protein ThiS
MSNDIDITCNGKSMHIPSGSSIYDVLQILKGAEYPLAVFLNGCHVQADACRTKVLKDHDLLRVMFFMSGG